MLPQVITPIDLYHSRSSGVVTSSVSCSHGGRMTTSDVLPVFGSALTTRSSVYWVHQPLPSASPAVPYTKLRAKDRLGKCIHVLVIGSNRFAPPVVAPQIFPWPSTSTVVSCPPPMLSGGVNISNASVPGSSRP